MEKKRLMKIVAVVLIAVAVIGGVYAFMLPAKTPEQSQSSQPEITSQNLKAVIKTNLTDNVAEVGQIIQFDGSESEGNIISYKWDFGDGTTDSGESVSHVYTSEGNYTVKLTVYDNNGDSNTTTIVIKVVKSSAVGEAPRVTLSCYGIQNPNPAKTGYLYKITVDSITRITGLENVTYVLRDNSTNEIKVSGLLSDLGNMPGTSTIWYTDTPPMKKISVGDVINIEENLGNGKIAKAGDIFELRYMGLEGALMGSVILTVST